MEDIHEIKKEYIGNGRKDTFNNDISFMLSALAFSKQSKDPSTQVGVCYVKDGKLLSVGYNSTPNNWSDDVFPWGKDENQGKENTKYPYVIHAEVNGIVNYNGNISDFKDSTAYVTLYPCFECAKLMVQIGVKKVVYLSNKYKEKTDMKISRTIFNKCGIECISFDEINNTEELNVNFKKEEYVKVKKIEYKKH